ncbi:hypothetical protein PHK61_26980 [Actinomycetospora lutea]|uniref:hypothetical protein n=1 Tax=Actinomycetospora lutea TaxID=663604 RepID=UPI0023668E71|nr:hypothetical protein [Actinomycetospora lutea]MDD7942065.1 hypothetical protein [Actinomycetospora lutea]
MDGSARQPAAQALSAGAILAVAEGLRWTDPQLSVALAEHVARSAGDDADARGAAERSAVLALGQSDHAAAVILRAVPLLHDAEREARATDAALLRCELALAAVRCEEVDGAEALLEPLAAGRVLPETVRADALVAWAAARAARGDVPGVDAAARQVEDLLGAPTDDVRRLTVQRSRAHARRAAGDATDALAVLRDATTGEASAESGRATAMLVAETVELLAELGRVDEAREAGAPVLATTPQATTALPVGRVRNTLARVSLTAGDLDTAARLAREAESDLLAHGHEAPAAEAVEVLADVAARRGESREALDELRRAHAHATAAREETTRARIALAVALARAEEPPPASDEPAPAPEEPAEVPPAADPDPLAAVRASLAALDVPGEASGPSPADLLSAALAATELGSFEDLTSPQGTEATAGSAEAPPAAPEQEPAPRRRRTRYRDEEDPGAALAAALAAARQGGIGAFATAAEPTPNGDQPQHGARDDAHPDPWGSARDAGSDDGAAETRSRRLARARARWETSDPLLPPRRPEAAIGDGTAPDGTGEQAGDDRRGRPDRPAEQHHAAHGERHHRHRAPPEKSADGGGAGAPDHDPAAGGLQVGPGGPSRFGDVGGSSGIGGAGLLGEDREAGRNGHGAVGGGQVMRDAARPITPRDDGPARAVHAVATGNGHVPAEPTGTDTRRDEEPVTVAGRRGDALGTVHGTSTADDDEYRRELALTLVDLLSEYEDAAPPPPVAGRTAATSAGPRADATPPAHSSRTGVPSARRADDSGPRLADLLADAMDAYHSADPGAHDRGARR